MRYIPLRFAAAVALFVLVACGGAVPPSNSSAPSAAVSAGDLVAPFGPDSPASYINDSPLRSDAPHPPNLHALRSREVPFSTVHNPGDHEDAGVGFNDTGRYTSLYAVHTFYPTLALSHPSGQAGTQWLFAPTTKAGCLENVTVYLNDGSGTQRQFSVFDWCNTIGYILSKNIDATFVHDYVRTLSNGRPGYQTEIYASSLKPTTGTVWRSLVYNHVTSRWDTMISLVQHKPPTYNGWSIFETYYLQGPCPVTPTISASSIYQYDTVTRAWRLMTASLPGITTSSSSGPPGACFVADNTGPATYTFTLTSPYYAWTVR